MKQNKLLKASVDKQRAINQKMRDFFAANGQADWSQKTVDEKYMLTQLSSMRAATKNSEFIPEESNSERSARKAEPIFITGTDVAGLIAELERKELPQTKEEYAALKKAIKRVFTQADYAPSNYEPNIQHMVSALMEGDPAEVQSKIVNFFRAFDDYKDESIQKQTRKLELARLRNKKLRNKQASNFTDKSELENLFLDCVDENKKDVIRQIVEKQTNPDVNLLPKNTGTRVLIEQVCTSKETLILLFEELFGRD